MKWKKNIMQEPSKTIHRPNNTANIYTDWKKEKKKVVISLLLQITILQNQRPIRMAPHKVQKKEEKERLWFLLLNMWEVPLLSLQGTRTRSNSSPEAD